MAIEVLSGFFVCTYLPVLTSSSLKDSSWSAKLQLIPIILQVSKTDGDVMEVLLKHSFISDYHHYYLFNIMKSTASQRGLRESQERAVMEREQIPKF